MAGSFVYAGIVCLFLLLIWQSAIWIFNPPSYLFPSPLAVYEAFANNLEYLISNMFITLKEMVLGFLLGSLAGICIALLLSQFLLLDRYLMPLVVVTQTLPVFAIAPLLVIWFGFGIGSKIVMASLIIFFPVTSAFYDGLKSTSSTWLDLAQSWRMSKFQTLVHFRIPAALPSLMTGLKVAATIAPIGAVVGEWAGAAGGLGFVMLQANARTQTAVVFASLVLLGLSAWSLRWIVVQLADHFVWWSGTRIS
jgi:putative hydroxymethylpyrimidine transport system permease protein